MFAWIMTYRVDYASFLTTIDAICAVVMLYLLVRRPSRRWFLIALAAVVIGVVAGLIACWLTSDVLDVFGVSLTPVTRMWVCLGFAGIAIAVVNLWPSRWWRKAVAIVSVPLFVVAAAAGINVDFGAYRNLNDAFGVDPYPALTLAHETANSMAQAQVTTQDWTPPAGMPTRGRIGTVSIPGTVSHFDARPAVVYLPPAALVVNPPTLPVMIVFSGQPGSPADLFTAGRLDSVLNAFASTHNGLAPIVVSPDQLLRPNFNPMCIDSPLGHSATYVMVDVMNWIRGNLRVSRDASSWAVGGYSQGATCALQFGAAHPDRFGTILAISSELGPTIGPSTVAKAFGGSKAAYAAAMPAAVMARNAPYASELAIFAVGQADTRYTRFAKTLLSAADNARMTTQFVVSPRTAHDWNTVRYSLRATIPGIAAHMGLK
ncbi:MAG: hypothetical protein JWP70_1202 [Leifsonia sp.]|jgi:enterochelin esterase-like enzyme|nr:hypothetical protein [Leifsonia sp.]MDQ1588932.1 hypothetical protein [Microbacteriaceae bacterium]